MLSFLFLILKGSNHLTCMLYIIQITNTTTTKSQYLDTNSKRAILGALQVIPLFFNLYHILEILLNYLLPHWKLRISKKSNKINYLYYQLNILSHLYLQREKQESANRPYKWWTPHQNAIRNRFCHSCMTKKCSRKFLCRRMRNFRFLAWLLESMSQVCWTDWTRWIDLSKKSSTNPFDVDYEWLRLCIPISETAYRILNCQWGRLRDPLKLRIWLVPGNFPLLHTR